MSGFPRSRGQWRPSRGFGRGQGGWSRPPQQVPGDRAPSPPLGTVSETIKRSHLGSMSGLASRDPKIQDCKTLASFNWTEEKAPTIIVPGIPPVWKPLSQPVQLDEDSGEYYRDQNAARFPEHPVEPAVKALLAQTHDIPTWDIDLFACGSTLGNLLRFVRGNDKTFRFTVETVGRTVFFVRRENTPDEKLVGVRGYGHAFPEKYTQWNADVKGSASHQRMISYTFAGLECVVRFEGDGYLEGLATESQSVTPDLSDSDGLMMRKGGRMIPQQAIFDLKTRSARRKDVDTLAEELPRLWVAQIQNFILAFHERGVFRDIRVQNVRKDVDEWEAANEHELRQLGALIHRIVDFVRKIPEGKCELRRREFDTLEIRSQLKDAPSALSAELRQIWIQGTASSPDSGEDEALDGAHASSQGSDASEEGVDLASFSDEEDEKDYTFCSDECDYCGRCRP